MRELKEFTKEMGKNILDNYTLDMFNKDAKAYVKALKQLGLIMKRESVSMYRSLIVVYGIMKRPNSNTFCFFQLNSFFKALGFKFTKNEHIVYLKGGVVCNYGFNYQVLEKLLDLKMISRKECEYLRLYNIKMI